jgi:hypothetical protein
MRSNLRDVLCPPGENAGYERLGIQADDRATAQQNSMFRIHCCLGFETVQRGGFGTARRERIRYSKVRLESKVAPTFNALRRVT